MAIQSRFLLQCTTSQQSYEVSVKDKTINIEASFGKPMSVVRQAELIKPAGEDNLPFSYLLHLSLHAASQAQSVIILLKQNN